MMKKFIIMWAACTQMSFIVFAGMAGIPTRLAQMIIDTVVQKAPGAIELVRRSFLSDEAKSKYIEIFSERLRLLSYEKGKKDGLSLL